MRHFSLFLVIHAITAIDILRNNSYRTDLEMRKFPDNIKLGVATAAYQIEGGWNASDKALSIWDVFCQKPGNIMDNTNGNVACNSYEYYKRDVQMLKFLGVQFYRFSISWPRLLPTGFANTISTDGKNYYNNLIDELLKNDIEPVVTMYHWDLPQNLQDLGGWANPLISDWFEHYARVLYTLFGDRVKTWITLNEPKQFGILGYGTKRFAPGINAAGIGDYMVVKNLLLAHARAWHIYDKEFRSKQNGVCGITIATDFREGVTDSHEDVETGEITMDFDVGLYSNPIFSVNGGFPPRVIKRVAERSAEQGFKRSRLPELSQEEIEYIKGTSDFYGFNHYSTRFMTTDGYTSGKYRIPSYEDDLGGVGTYLDYERGAVIHCTMIPKGIRKALRWVKENCNNPPIMITENGFGTYNGLDDKRRVAYYQQYLDSILDAIQLDGCNVTTYTAWSLMDNFEWDSGLSVKFGLFETDYEDQKKTRTARLSALWYKHLIETRTLDMSYMPVLEKITF